MKILKKCPILTGIVAITIALSIVSLIFKDTLYSEYADKYESGDIPLLALALKGATDEVFPWSSGEQEALLPEDTQGADEGKEPSEQADDTAGGEEDPGAFDISGNDISGNDISGNDISGNDISGNDISGNSEEVYEFTEVDDDYFTDAVFIGDSRTVGLSEYCEPLDSRATFYARTSLTIYDVFKKEYIKTDTGKIGLEEALSRNQFGKVYIMLGLNEIGTGDTEYFINAFRRTVCNRVDYAGILERLVPRNHCKVAERIEPLLLLDRQVGVKIKPLHFACYAAAQARCIETCDGSYPAPSLKQRVPDVADIVADRRHRPQSRYNYAPLA